jgi:hypothetical protein
MGGQVIASLLIGLSILHVGLAQWQFNWNYISQMSVQPPIQPSRQQRPWRNLCKLEAPRDRWTDMSLGFGTYKRKTKGTFNAGMFVDTVRFGPNTFLTSI